MLSKFARGFIGSPARAAGAVFMISAGLSACASVAPVLMTDPTPVAVQALGPSDQKYNHGDDEARRLAGVKGAWRRGEVLTVDTNEGIQLRFVDAGVCEGFYTCRRWIFRGSTAVPAKVPSGPNDRVDYWLIEFEQGEGGYWLAVDAESGSSKTLDTEPVISGDKRRWATGECNEESGDNLTIFEAGDVGQLTAAATAAEDSPCCEIVGWDGEALKVKLCDLEPGKAYPDRLVRQANGVWAGKRIHLEKPRAP